VIGYLRGKIRDRTEGCLVVDVGGGGFDVHVDRQTMKDLAQTDAEVELYVRTVVRDDGITLYGFLDKVSRDAFDMLTQVSGVGPKSASQILGGMPFAEFVEAVRTKDVRRLAQIPGVGRKIAERMALELSERFMALPVEGPSPRAGIPAALVDDLRSALSNLGYGAREVEAALRSLRPGQADLQELLKQAIAHLSTR